MRPLTRALGFVLVATALRAQDPANLAVGRPYTLTPAPDYALCTDAEDTRQLTDGVTVPPGKQIWVDQRCVGWRRREPVEVVIDLGQAWPLAQIVVPTDPTTLTGSLWSRHHRTVQGALRGFLLARSGFFGVQNRAGGHLQHGLPAASLAHGHLRLVCVDAANRLNPPVRRGLCLCSHTVYAPLASMIPRRP